MNLIFSFYRVSISVVERDTTSKSNHLVTHIIFSSNPSFLTFHRHPDPQREPQINPLVTDRKSLRGKLGNQHSQESMRTDTVRQDDAVGRSQSRRP